MRYCNCPETLITVNPDKSKNETFKPYQKRIPIPEYKTAYHDCTYSKACRKAAEEAEQYADRKYPRVKEDEESERATLWMTEFMHKMDELRKKITVGDRVATI